jgi:signal transduction histidine kinase
MISSEGALSPIEIPARHRNGNDIILEIRPARLTGTEGKLKGLRGVTVDITERKRAEDSIRLANRQLHLLTGITRHDILNKISVILGFLKITEKKFNDPALTEYLRKMESATTAIRSQIEFTRVYQNIGTHEPRWIGLDSVMPRSHMPATITLNANVQDILVFADPMLERVFFNLLDNSIRHGQRVTEIRVSCHQSGKDLVVVWEDNGVGIAANEKERIFERGFGKNTGLGMFLGREILSLTGITITETGESGNGARFEIVVPKGAFRLAVEH